MLVDPFVVVVVVVVVVEDVDVLLILFVFVADVLLHKHVYLLKSNT